MLAWLGNIKGNMNERDVKLAALINELVEASYENGYLYGDFLCENASTTDRAVKKQNKIVEELKKKLFEELNIRIV